MLTLALVFALQAAAPADPPLSLDPSIAAAAEQETAAPDAAEPPAAGEEAQAAGPASEAADTPASDASANQAAADAPAVPEPTADEVAALTDGIESGFRACAIQVANRGHIARERADALKAVGITLGEVPPDGVVTVASKDLPDDRVYARVDSKAGMLWLMASPTRPLCKITAADTRAVPAAAQRIAERLAKNITWKADAGRSHVTGEVQRRAWTQIVGSEGAQLLLVLDGPTQPSDGGKGIQAILSVALVNPKAD